MEQIEAALTASNVRILGMIPAHYGDAGGYCTGIKLGFTGPDAVPHQPTKACLLLDWAGEVKDGAQRRVLVATEVPSMQGRGSPRREVPMARNRGWDGFRRLDEPLPNVMA